MMIILRGLRRVLLSYVLGDGGGGGLSYPDQIRKMEQERRFSQHIIDTMIYGRRTNPESLWSGYCVCTHTKENAITTNGADTVRRYEMARIKENIRYKLRVRENQTNIYIYYYSYVYTSIDSSVGVPPLFLVRGMRKRAGLLV